MDGGGSVSYELISNKQVVESQDSGIKLPKRDICARVGGIMQK